MVYSNLKRAYCSLDEIVSTRQPDARTVRDRDKRRSANAMHFPDSVVHSRGQCDFADRTVRLYALAFRATRASGRKLPMVDGKSCVCSTEFGWRSRLS